MNSNVDNVGKVMVHILKTAILASLGFVKNVLKPQLASIAGKVIAKLVTKRTKKKPTANKKKGQE